MVEEQGITAEVDPVEQEDQDVDKEWKLNETIAKNVFSCRNVLRK